MLLPRPDAPARDAPRPPDAGVLLPWPAVLFTWGPGGRSELHAHHAWHLVVGLDGPLAVREPSSAAARAAEAVLTAPDVPHAIDGLGTAVAIVFVAPESETGARLAARGLPAVARFDEPEAARLRRLLHPAAGAAADPAGAIATALSLPDDPIGPPAGGHPAVRRVIRRVRAAPPSADTSLEALAALAKLSPGRFQHAFTATVGIPLRPWLRWLRLERAGAALAAGATLSEAAHAAGFADGAHMTRTFRQMFGVTPSDASRRSRSVQDP